MKVIVLFLVFSISLDVAAQDTTQLVKHYDKTKSFWIVSATDTMMYSCYPNGKKETERKYNHNGKTVLYKRWYENGKLMWEREIKNNKANGKSILYDDKGKRVAEFVFAEDILTDAVFIKDGMHIVFGKITYSSVVYGGMQREDGSSNISEHSGPWMYTSMYAVKTDSLKNPQKVQNFRSDHNGEFFILAPEGEIGFFLQSTPIEKLKPGDFIEPSHPWSSGHSGWNLTKPLTVNKEDKLLFILLHHSSVGYAP